MNLKNLKLLIPCFIGFICLGFGKKEIKNFDRPNKLTNEWIISELYEKNINNPECTITFNGKLYNAYIGCNQIYGNIKYKKDKGSVIFSNGFSTRRFCPDDDNEMLLLKAIDSAKFVEKSENSLYLLDNKCKRITKLVPKIEESKPSSKGFHYIKD